ncbi:MAG: GNAT family N-acetyltransferase [Oscillospiraceae bacterium]
MEELVLMTKDDIETCRKIYFDAFGYSANGVCSILSEIYSFEEYFFQCIDDNDKYAYCIKNNLETVGFITAWNQPSILDESITYIDIVAVAPLYQKQGFGTRMMSLFIEHVGKDRMFSLQTNRKKPAYKMYKKLGFIDDENTVTMVKSQAIDQLQAENEELMEKCKNLIKEIETTNKL